MAKKFNRKKRWTKKPKARGERVVDEPKQLDESAGEKTEGKSTIKLKLASVLNDVDPVTGEPLPKEEFLSIFEKCVEFSSEASHRCGIALQRALIMWYECPDRMERYGSIDLLLHDQTFYRQLLRAHHDTELYPPGKGPRETPFELVDDVRQRFYTGPAPFEPLPDRRLEPIIYDNKAREHMTNALNHFTLNFKVYQVYSIKAFLREHLDKAPAASVEKILGKIVGEKVDISGIWDPADALLDDFIDQHRAQLGIPSLEEEEESGESVMPDDFYYEDEDGNVFDKKDCRDWVENNLDIVVPYFLWMVKGLEEESFGERPKLAKPCPSYDVKSHHLVVDSTMFLKILKAIGAVDDTRGGTDLNKDGKWKNDSRKERHWVRWVDFRPFEVNSERLFKSFHLYLVSDGTAGSLVFDVERIVSHGAIPRDHDEFLEYHRNPDSLSHTDYRLGSMDPGETNIGMAAIEVRGENGEESTYKYSSYRLGQHRNDGLINRARRANEKRNKRADCVDYHAACAQFSTKTASLAKLDQLEELMHKERDDGTTLYDSIWAERRRNCYGESKFRTWRASTSSISSFVSSLQGKDEAPLILFYGNGSWGHGKGNPSAPNKKFLAECKRQHTVILVDEWMTSQTCPVCSNRFPKTVKKRAPGEKFDWRRHYVRGLLRCSECLTCCYWDRDVVGARCILILGTTQWEDLPEMLRRDFADERPERGYHKLVV